MWQRVRSGSTAAAAIAALVSAAGPSWADIDTNGRWVIRGPWGVYLAYEVETWTQAGTTISTSNGYTGTIAPATGEFSMSRPGVICPADTRTGTVAADGLSLTGFDLIHPTFSPTACFNGLGANITGSRCPSGTIEAGEGCDDGNVMDGDGCDNTCAVEMCWTCSGSPSSCSPLPNCGCANGILEAGESCDDGNLFDGDGCDHTCAVETCWSCSGAPSACSPQLAGSPCTGNDGVACTINGACDTTHQCSETPADYLCDDAIACTTDVCDPTLGCLHTPISCDDGNPCTADSCVITCAHLPIVRSDCRTAEASALKLSVGTGSRDTLTWTLKRAQSTSLQDFADPQDAGDYRFCVFADPNHTTTVAAALVPADASRWRATAHGFNYKDAAAAAAGITRVKLIASDANRTKIGIKGEGTGLDVTAPPVPLPLTAQLTNIQSNECWSVTYDAAAVSQNGAGKLNARATSP